VGYKLQLTLLKPFLGIGNEKQLNQAVQEDKLDCKILEA